MTWSVTLGVWGLALLAAQTLAQNFGEIVPYDKRVAVQCIPANGGSLRLFNATAGVYGNWTFIPAESASTGAILRFYNKTIRENTYILRVGTNCLADRDSTPIQVDISSTGVYNSTFLTTNKIHQAISNFSLEFGYQLTSYKSTGESRVDLNSNECLVGSGWNDNITSLSLEDLRYFYIRSNSLSNFARVNTTFVDTNGQTELKIYRDWPWEAFRFLNNQFLNPFFGNGLNCDSLGVARASSTPSTVRILVPTVADSNSVTAVEDTPLDFKINMKWEHDQGYFLCNVTFAAADVQAVGTFTLLNCSSNSTAGSLTATSTPFFWVRYTPLPNYQNSTARAISYTFWNGPFAFTSTFSLTVSNTNDPPVFNAVSRPYVLYTNELGIRNFTVYDIDPNDSVRASILSVTGATAYINRTFSLGGGNFTYTLVFTPQRDYVGPVFIQLSATDNAGATTIYTHQFTFQEAVGDTLPYDKRVAVYCTPYNDLLATPRFLNTSVAGTPWKFIDAASAGQGSVLRFFNKTIRVKSESIFQPTTGCASEANRTAVTATFSVGSYSASSLRSLNLFNVIRNYSLELGYQVTAYKGDLAGDVRADYYDNGCLDGSGWSNNISSFVIKELNFFYIRSEVYSNFARLNLDVIDANTVVTEIPKYWTWEAWKYINNSFYAPFYRDFGFNCDSFGNTTGSTSLSHMRLVVPTTSDANSFVAYQNIPSVFKVNMKWEHDQGLFLCNVSFVQTDLSATVGLFSLVNCSSNATSLSVTSTTTPYFYVRYSPVYDYVNTAGRNITYTFWNGPFTFTNTFNLRVLGNSAPTIDAITTPTYIANEVASINVTARDTDSGDFVTITLGTVLNGVATVSSSPVSSTSNSWTYTITFTPNSGYIGSASIKVIATDSRGAVENADLLITYIAPSTTPSASASASPSTTASPSVSSSPSPSVTASVTSSPSASITASPSASVSASVTSSPSPSETASPSITASPSASVTPSITSSPSPSETPSSSVTASASLTPSPSATPSLSLLASPSPSASVSESASPSPSISESPSVTPSPSISESASVSPSPSISESASVTPSPSASESASVTPSPSASESASITPSPSASESASITPSPSASESASVTPTPAASESASTTPTPSISESASSSPSPSQSPSSSVSASASPEPEWPEPSGDIDPSLGPSVTPTSSVSPSVEPSQTPSPSAVPTTEASVSSTPSAEASASAPVASPTAEPQGAEASPSPVPSTTTPENLSGDSAALIGIIVGVVAGVVLIAAITASVIIYKKKQAAQKKQTRDVSNPFSFL